MKKYFTKFIAIFIFSFILISTPVLAQNLQDAFSTSEAHPAGGSSETALSTVADGAGYSPANTFNSMIGKIILTALSLLGIIFLILLIYAGYLWMTASGNEQQVSKAQSIITTAIVGLVIVLSAYSISYFVLNSLQEETLRENTSTSESA